MFLTIQPWPLMFKSPVAYTDPQELRAELPDEERPIDDYGRPLDDEEDAFEDDPTESAQ